MSSPHRVLAGVLLGLALAGCNRPSATDPVHVGYLAPASDSGRKGVQLAVKEANEANGLVAGRRLALLAPDLGDGANSMAAVATRLIAVNRVPALIGGPDGPHADLLGRAAQPHNALVIATCVLPVAQLAENVFPAQLALADQGTLLARFVAEELKADRVAVVAAPGGQYAELATAFARQLTKDDGSRQVTRHSFDEKTTWTKLAAEVQEGTPKAVLVIGSAADFARLRGALREAGSKAPLLFGGTLTERLELQANQDMSQEVYVATLYVADGDASYGTFAANYQKEFGEEPDQAARLAYDAGKVLTAALRRSNLISRDRLREELAKAFVARLAEGKLTDARSYKLPGR